MRRWIGRRRKALAIALLGLVEVAAYILADPGELPGWVVSAAAVVNVLGVYYAPKNAAPARSRRDLIDHLPPPTRAAKPDERPGPYRGGHESGSRLATEMPPPSTGIKRPDERKPPGETSFP